MVDAATKAEDAPAEVSILRRISSRLFENSISHLRGFNRLKQTNSSARRSALGLTDWGRERAMASQVPGLPLGGVRPVPAPAQPPLAPPFLTAFWASNSLSGSRRSGGERRRRRRSGFLEEARRRLWGKRRKEGRKGKCEETRPRLFLCAHLPLLPFLADLRILSPCFDGSTNLHD